MNANSKVLNTFMDQTAEENSMQTEVQKSLEYVEMREKLEATAAKMKDLANQLPDDHEVRRELSQIADLIYGKIDPDTVKVTWAYKDPFNSLADIVYLVRTPENNEWISIDALPAQTRDALVRKINAGEIEDDQPERERWPLWARTVRDQPRE